MGDGRQQDGDIPEKLRRQDGAGRREPLPGGEASRGNVEPVVDAPAASEEVWTPERGTRKSDPSQEMAAPGTTSRDAG